MNKWDIEIKEATDLDTEKLASFASRAFLDAYSGTMNGVDMDSYISKSFNKRVLLSQILAPDMIFHIAWQHDEIIGYTKLRWDRQRPELIGYKAIELERIYVAARHYRTGLGSVLLNHALEFSRHRKFEMLWLAVWQNNERALFFYKKAGLEIFGVQEFTVGTIINNDFVLKIKL